MTVPAELIASIEPGDVRIRKSPLDLQPFTRRPQEVLLKEDVLDRQLINVERAQNLVSHHLKALRAAGLVDYRRDGKRALYSLTEQGRTLLELADVGAPARV
jgi:DNA-binding transcriptional ArsR family regulator